MTCHDCSGDEACEECEADADEARWDARAARLAEPAHIYRAFCAAGTLLYVGVTADVDERMRRHARSSAWHAEMARLAANATPSRDLALMLEQHAIATEHPTRNRSGGVCADGTIWANGIPYRSVTELSDAIEHLFGKSSRSEGRRHL
jgi:predicted GIY-YIG superfamily endonuclease